MRRFRFNDATLHCNPETDHQQWFWRRGFAGCGSLYFSDVVPRSIVLCAMLVNHGAGPSYRSLPPANANSAVRRSLRIVRGCHFLLPVSTRSTYRSGTTLELSTALTPRPAKILLVASTFCEGYHRTGADSSEFPGVSNFLGSPEVMIPMIETREWHRRA